LTKETATPFLMARPAKRRGEKGQLRPDLRVDLDKKQKRKVKQDTMGELNRGDEVLL